MANKNLFLTSAQRHQALLSRDPLAHSSFVYSVITTKIYCRPTCPSRLARRANIVFHESAAEAERDGFRACRRCRPDVGEDIMKKQGNGSRNGNGKRRKNITGNSEKMLGGDDLGEMGRGKRIVDKAIELIENEMKIGGKKWTLNKMAEEVGLTESHFCRIFKRETGGTVGEYRLKVMGRQLWKSPESNATPSGGDVPFETGSWFDWDSLWEEAIQMDAPDANLSFLDLGTPISLDVNADDGMEFLDLECYGD